MREEREDIIDMRQSLELFNRLFNTNFKEDDYWWIKEIVDDPKQLHELFLVNGNVEEVPWHIVCAFMSLSEDFIREFKDEVDWYYIDGCQKLCKKFREEFKDKIQKSKKLNY